LCWQRQPASRPEFSTVVEALGVIGEKYNVHLQHESPDIEMTPRVPQEPLSPDMHPYTELPPISPGQYKLYFILCVRF
jgi:hypothetical protein